MDGLKGRDYRGAEYFGSERILLLMRPVVNLKAKATKSHSFAQERMAGERSSRMN